MRSAATMGRAPDNASVLARRGLKTPYAMATTPMAMTVRMLPRNAFMVCTSADAGYINGSAKHVDAAYLVFSNEFVSILCGIQLGCPLARSAIVIEQGAKLGYLPNRTVNIAS